MLRMTLRPKNLLICKENNMPLIKRDKTSMGQEIFEQKDIVQTILDTYIDNGSINIEIPNKINRVVLVASGSSYHCARYAAELFGLIANLDARAIYSSEFLLKSAFENSEDVLYVFITQSGETTDTNSALEKAKECGIKTLCITNKEDSTIWNAAQYKILCHAGEEKSIAATKSLTSQLLCALLLVLKMAQSRGIEVSDRIRDLNDITDIIDQAYQMHSKIKELARFISNYKNIVISADGSSYALAKEASLKIKETSYLNTHSYILGEFMHGHVALLNNKKSLLLYILNDDITYTAIKNLNKIKENYNPPICVIGDRTNQIKSAYNLNIDCQKPIVKTFGLLVIIQLLALEIALKLGKNVDKPHGLNKVVK